MTDFDLPGTESTSAALRRLEAERDEALAVQKDAVDAFTRITDRCTLLQAELDAVRTARDNLDRQLADAARNGWIVARDGGRDCLRCDQEIRRGEAYEYMPTTDQLQHIHCPDPSTEGAPTE